MSLREPNGFDTILSREFVSSGDIYEIVAVDASAAEYRMVWINPSYTGWWFVVVVNWKTGIAEYRCRTNRPFSGKSVANKLIHIGHYPIERSDILTSDAFLRWLAKGCETLKVRDNVERKQ